MDALPTEPRPSAAARTATSTLVVVGIVGAVALMTYAAQGFLLLLAGAVFGVLLDAQVRVVKRATGLGRRAALGVVLALMSALLAGAMWLVVPTVVDQVTRLVERVPEAWSKVAERAFGDHERPVRQLERAVRQVDPAVFRPVVRSVTATLTILGSLFVVVVIGIYAAARPDLYVEGSVRLLPHAWRDLAREAIHDCGRQLRRLLLGVGVAISSAGVLTGVGLWLLGIPYALGLGLLAALLEIIPNVGPLAAAIPAILLSLADEEIPWWHVALMYVVVQTVQSYAIQPLVQQHMVEVPPVVLIGTVVLLGWLVGPLGFLMGVPLLVIVRVLVRNLYQREVLGERAVAAADG